MNEIEKKERDSMRVTRKTQIDVMLGNKEMLQATKGNKIIDFDQFILTHHRNFLFNLDTKQLFNIEPSDCDKSETRKLNLNNRKHEQIFKETLESHETKLKLLEKLKHAARK